MIFNNLASYLQKLEDTSSRLEMTEILAKVLGKSDKDDIDKVVYLILGNLGPSYEGVVFNVAEKMMIRVISLAYGEPLDYVRDEYKKIGDLGDVAYRFAQKRNSVIKGKNLTTTQVYKELLNIAKDEGKNSQDRKINRLAELLKMIQPLSAKYLARIPVGKLRLGFSDKTILDALSWMETGNKSRKGLLKKAYEVLPDVGKLARKVKAGGSRSLLKDVAPEVGVPVLPMLAQRLKSTSEMVEKMGKVFVEPKFDGLRVLIHFRRGRKGEDDFVRAYTRNLNDVFSMFPELKGIGKYINADSAIIDSEAVGMDPEMQKIADFQTTMKRRRKHGISETIRKIPLRFQVFDIILKNNKNLMKTPYFKRREILKGVIKVNKLLVVDDAYLTQNPDEIKRIHLMKLREGLEGVIVKKYDTEYVPGRLGWRWVKMKETEESVGKLADTIDCVVMGYSRGRGKRAGFGVGQFLAGILDGKNIVTITKVGTGLKDDDLTSLGNELSLLRAADKPDIYRVQKDYFPDYWIEAKIVVEIAGDEITKSPKHTSGYAIRFPKLVKIRRDKNISQATTLREVKDILRLQK